MDSIILLLLPPVLPMHPKQASPAMVIEYPLHRQEHLYYQQCHEDDIKHEVVHPWPHLSLLVLPHYSKPSIHHSLHPLSNESCKILLIQSLEHEVHDVSMSVKVWQLSIIPADWLKKTVVEQVIPMGMGKYDVKIQPVQ